jgi:hypothetical protein
MKKSNMFKLVLVLSGSCLLATGCYVEARGPRAEVAVAAPGEVYVDSAPPALLADPQPVMPGDGFIWIGGGWLWEGGRWRWHGGRWERPPHPGAHWAANHYEFRGGRHVFVRGGWR